MERAEMATHGTLVPVFTPGAAAGGHATANVWKKQDEALDWEISLSLTCLCDDSRRNAGQIHPAQSSSGACGFPVDKLTKGI